MDTLRVRVYNVLFGDAILVSIPERAATGAIETRHILFDVGNAEGSAGGADTVFEPIIRDIQATIGGDTVDLYVMTHEHMDHVQGLLYVATKVPGVPPLKARYAWLTGSAKSDYYDTHPSAKKEKSLHLDAYHALQEFFAAAAEPASSAVQTMLTNNNPRSTTACVDHLRELAAVDKTAYVSRGVPSADSHPFVVATLEIWAPEEDTSAYYRRLQPLAMVGGHTDQDGHPSAASPVPPPGVDAGAFYDLVDARRQGAGDNLLAIDQAANNSSVVVCLEWRGWRLLFPGDAEQASWKMMDKLGVLKPVHFLKVGHHGSVNGTPPPAILEKILPAAPPDTRQRRALVSTHLDSYNGVPDFDTLTALGARCAVQATCVVRAAADKPVFEAPGFTGLDLAPGAFIDVLFEG